MTKLSVIGGYPKLKKRIYSRVTDSDLKSSDQMFRWSLELADYRGKWGFDTQVFRDKWCKEIRPKLLAFEDYTWGQLASQSKGQAQASLCFRLKPD